MTEREQKIAERLAKAADNPRGQWWDHDGDEIEYYVDALLSPQQASDFYYWLGNAADDIKYLLGEVERLRAAQPLIEAAQQAVEYHTRRSDTEYPGYIWVEWEDIVRFVTVEGEK
jgi:hypothetical protein